MEAYGSRNTRANTASRLTQLYTDTKHSSQTAVPPRTESSSPEKRSFDRKFSLQKDRLIAWGFDWTDNINDGDIDQSVERAGLTEVVESIMENIKSIIEDVERMNMAGPSTPSHSTFPAEKLASSSAQARSWMPSELAKYEDLIKDMMNAIDLLCDLSKSRRASQQHAYSKADEASGKSDKKRQASYLDRPSTPVPAYPVENAADSPVGMPGVPLTRTQSGPYSIPMISASSLVLPREGPPAYGDSRTIMRGAASSPRLFGDIRQITSGGSQASVSLVPVMIEYAAFDKLYRVPGMELPRSSRLEQLHSILRSWDSNTSSVLARPIAYFEDPEHARYGLVFNRPQSIKKISPQGQGEPQQQPQSSSGQPTTLSTLLHQASRLPSQQTVPLAPALEDRFRLAQQLVSGFRFLQQHDFAHRNVSSANIAVLPKLGQDAYDIRRPLICSIDLFSDYDVDPSPEHLLQNIYRHPDDPRIRGPSAAPAYDIRFDLYSLSLVLLEIGMWHPLADLYKEKYSLKDFGVRVDKVWIRRLVGRCGNAYTRCVRDLFEAGNGQDESINLIQTLNKVAARLDRCCAIDLEEDESEMNIETEANVASPAPASAVPSMVTEATSMTGPAPSSTPKRTLFQDLELPNDILAQYSSFEGQVVRITEKILKKTQESCWIDLLYSGESKDSARPTICVGCSSTKLVRSALKKYLQYDHTIFDLAVFKDTVRRSKSPDHQDQKGQ